MKVKPDMALFASTLLAMPFIIVTVLEFLVNYSRQYHSQSIQNVRAEKPEGVDDHYDRIEHKLSDCADRLCSLNV